MSGWGALMFPLMISGSGILVCMLTNFVATDLCVVKKEADIERVLKTQARQLAPTPTQQLHFPCSLMHSTCTT